jgi:hypothetical protein
MGGRYGTEDGFGTVDTGLSLRIQMRCGCRGVGWPSRAATIGCPDTGSEADQVPSAASVSILNFDPAGYSTATRQPGGPGTLRSAEDNRVRDTGSGKVLRLEFLELRFLMLLF